MSAWRKKAMDCAPELKKEFEQPGLTLYTVFMELLPILRKAHKENNTDRLEKIYGFAEWCLKQKQEALWNPAGVSFYEHLTDHEETFSSITSWVKKETFSEIRSLLAERLDEEKMKQLDDFYGWSKRKKKAF